MLEKTYLAKQMICPIGLKVEKIHACSNDCIFYRGEKYKDLDRCPKCEAPQYKEGLSDEGTKTRGGPVKVVWYFPIAPGCIGCLHVQSQPSCCAGMVKSVRKIQ